MEFTSVIRLEKSKEVGAFPLQQQLQQQNKPKQQIDVDLGFFDLGIPDFALLDCRILDVRLCHF